MNLDNPLPFADNSFDVVHTHQVLVHLSDPISALIGMRRACKPGGFIASREGDIAASVTFPDLLELQELREVYEKFIRTRGAEPRAGRYLRYWALQAGFRDDRITYTSTPMLYAGPETTRWWAALQAELLGGDELGAKLISKGLVRRKMLRVLVRLVWNEANIPGLFT